MRKLALSLLALLALAGAQALGQGGPTVGPTNAPLCNKIGTAAPASATTTAVISGVAGQIINICGWHVTSNQSGVTTFQFEYGTQGGPCTSPTTITPAMSVTSTAPSVDHQQLAVFTVPAGAQVCVVTTGTTVGQGIVVWYSQF